MIAQGLVSEYDSIDFPSRDRNREYYFIVDKLVYNHPDDALIVLRAVLEVDLSSQAIEGIGGGPVRDLLMLYGDRYNGDIDDLIAYKPVFGEIVSIAREGLG